MNTIENNFSPVEDFLLAGDSMVIQGNDWDDAVIRTFERHGAHFKVNTEPFPHLEPAFSNVLVLDALGCGFDDIYALTGLGTQTAFQAIRQELRVQHTDPEVILHHSFMRGLLSVECPASQPPVVMPTEIGGIAGAAAGLTDAAIATKISRNQTIKGFKPELFTDIMRGFYERVGISDRIGSVLFGHAAGILDIRAPLSPGTPGSKLILGQVSQ